MVGQVEAPEVVDQEEVPEVAQGVGPQTAMNPPNLVVSASTWVGSRMNPHRRETIVSWMKSCLPTFDHDLPRYAHHLHHHQSIHPWYNLFCAAGEAQSAMIAAVTRAHVFDGATPSLLCFYPSHSRHPLLAPQRSWHPMRSAAGCPRLSRRHRRVSPSMKRQDASSPSSAGTLLVRVFYDANH